MPYLRNIVGRFISIVIVILGISILIFIVSRVIPSDPARLIAGPRASDVALDNIRHEYGLDLPLWQQYFNYIKNAAQLDFGQSFSSRRSVNDDIAEYLPATIELSLFALFLSLLISIPLGILSATWHGEIIDNISRFLTVLGISLPAFWVGLLGQLFFYHHLEILPYGERLSFEVISPPFVTGLLLIDSLIAGRTDVFIDALYHLVLPGFVLALETLAFIFRFIRNNIVETSNDGYIIFARSKGYGKLAALIRHGFPNTLLSLTTVIGLLLGYLLAGSVLIEVIFSWPGIGRYAARALVSADYNAVMAVAIIMSVFYVVINAVVDWIYTLIDPRVKL